MTIVITLPHFFDGEAERIAQLLRRGDIDLIHLRKPQANRDELEALIRAIPEELHQRLVLHDHHTLALSYQLRGIHLNSRNHVSPDGWKGQLSISCHSIENWQKRNASPSPISALAPSSTAFPNKATTPLSQPKTLQRHTKKVSSTIG